MSFMLHNFLGLITATLYVKSLWGHITNILSRVWVTIEGIWIGNRIY
jgi:hypothetical protein